MCECGHASHPMRTCDVPFPLPPTGKLIRCWCEGLPEPEDYGRGPSYTAFSQQIDQDYEAYSLGIWDSDPPLVEVQE